MHLADHLAALIAVTTRRCTGPATSTACAFGVTTHGIWTQHDADAPRLVALISYPDGSDPAAVTTAYMASPGFAADMDGFNADDIVNVSEALLDPR